MISVSHVGAARYQYLRATSNFPHRRIQLSQTPVRCKPQGVSLVRSTSGFRPRRVFPTSVNLEIAGLDKSNKKKSLQNSKVPYTLTRSSYPLTYSEYGPVGAFTSEGFVSHVHARVINIVNTPIVLLLITPSLTSFLKNGNPFIPNLLRKAFHRPFEAQEVDVLAAVVDRISFPHESVLKDTGIGQKEAPHGSEGISVLIADSQQTAPDLWSPKRLDNCEKDLGDGKPSFLSFQFSSKDGLDISQNIKKPAAIYTVDLPLANTIFMNGKTSTMVSQRWSFASNTESRPDLICLKHTLLQQQNILLPEAKSSSEQLINLPLFQKLTAPRMISESMGNIIRRLRVSHDSSSTMPASEELEKSLGAWTSDQVNAHEIWARLTPRERWSGLPQIMGKPSEVERGSRLHKVLSGGGGWGNKQGLISLDPGLRFAISSVQNVFGDEEDIERKQYDILGEIARPGDSIQFYAFEQSSSHSSFESPKAMETSAPHTITIGNITSQQDAMPSTTTAESSDPGRLVVHGHFGALSESGISLDIQLCLEDATSYGSQKMGTVVQTKLPPLSYFCWRAK